MQGRDLKELRKAAGLTQAEMGELLHLTGAFIGEMERGEKQIDPRTADLIDMHLRHRIDVSFSDALTKWVVAVVGPHEYATRVSRMHKLVAAKADKNDAEARAYQLQREEYPLARVIIHPKG